MFSFRNTKIVATMGPACASPEVVQALVEAGMNVVRLNFSHGTHEQHRASIRMVRQVARQMQVPVAILQDLSGPKLRIGEIAQGYLTLQKDSEVALLAQGESKAALQLPIPGLPWLPREVKPGQHILLDDGSIQLLVKETTSGEILCTVVSGGIISSHKGINLPDTVFEELEIPTEKDRKDLAFGLQEGVDYVALSFVRTAQDVRNLRQWVTQAGAYARIVAKIEKREALNNIEEIVDEADGVMVARGDLGVETELEMVTLKQKEIISLCNRRGKVVITATQMLQSMISSPTPTRAEVSDVTNAILDGTDAVMLSGETAVGQYPVESVRMMASIANKTEAVFESDRLRRQTLSEPTMDAAVAHAACLLAKELEASAIVTNTETGHTAVLVSRYRPRPPILAMSRNESVVRQMALVWGVYPVLIEDLRTTDELFTKATATILDLGMARKGDRVVITAGVPIWQPATTNLVEVARL